MKIYLYIPSQADIIFRILEIPSQVTIGFHVKVGAGRLQFPPDVRMAQVLAPVRGEVRIH